MSLPRAFWAEGPASLPPLLYPWSWLKQMGGVHKGTTWVFESHPLCLCVSVQRTFLSHKGTTCGSSFPEKFFLHLNTPLGNLETFSSKK